MRSGIRQFAVAPSSAASKNCNIVLYLHAKFGEDRTTRAGCMSEFYLAAPKHSILTTLTQITPKPVMLYNTSDTIQLQSLRYIIVVSENLLPVWLLVRTNLYIPSRFWTTCTKFDNCCQRYIMSCGKKLYRCTSTVSALNYYNGIFFKSLRYLYEVVRTNFSADFFWTFRNFWQQFC